MNQPVEREKPGRVTRAMQRLMPKLTPAHVWAYRALGGRLVNKGSGGAPVLLVTATGRHTGEPRTVAVGHMRVGGDVVVAGTNGGLEPLPSWILNLRADPNCEVQIGSQRYEAEAEFLEADEFDEHWSRLVGAYPVYNQASRWAGRTVPLVRLRRVEAST